MKKRAFMLVGILLISIVMSACSSNSKSTTNENETTIIQAEYILIFVLGMMGMITIIFFLVEKLLGDGRCYIPQSAIMIALMLCVFWQIALITVACLLGRRIKKIFHGVVKMMMTIVTVSGTLCLVLFLAWNWLIYSFKFDEKVEQYDEHIALYVNNTFVRTRFRYPHYMYEENWLIMRTLSDDELQEAVLKYGDPDDYYN